MQELALQTIADKATNRKSEGLQPSRVAYPMGSNQDALSGKLGAGLPGAIDRSGALRPIGAYMEFLHNHPGRAALLGAGLGTGAGALAGAVTGRDPSKTSLVGLMAGGGLAGLASYLMQRNLSMAKQSSMLDGGDSLGFLQSRLMGDPGMSFQQKSALIPALEQLDHAQLRELVSLIKLAAGAGIGMLISRYLMGLGLIGTGIGGLLGGIVGSGLLGPSRNAIGQAQDRRRDIFGQARPF